MWIPIIDSKRYPVRCIIRTPSQGGGIVIRFDRAGRRTRKNGKEHWRLKYDRANARPAAFKNILYNKKGAPFADLYNPIKGDYYNTNFDDGKIEVMDEDMRQWFIGEMEWRETNFKKGPGWFEKYQGPFMLIIFAFALMLVFIGYGQFIAQAGGPMLSVAGNLAAAAESLGTAAQALQGGLGVIPPS